MYDATNCQPTDYLRGSVTMRVLVSDPIADEGVEMVRQAGIEVDVKTGLGPEELERTIGGYDVIIVRSATKVRKPLIEAGKDLKLIVRAGVGLDNIDVEYAKARGIEVMNTPAASTNAVAELTVGYLFALSCVANITWLFLWHYEVFVLTLVAMLALLLLLIAIYLRLDIGRAQVSGVERWLVDVPFSVYLGWITVATIANVTVVLDYLGWNGWGISPQVWTVIMLFAGLVIATAMSLMRGDVAYSLVLIWAYVGIAVKHGDTPVVAVSAWVTAALIGLMLVIGVLLKRQRQRAFTTA